MGHLLGYLEKERFMGKDKEGQDGIQVRLRVGVRGIFRRLEGKGQGESWKWNGKGEDLKGGGVVRRKRSGILYWRSGGKVTRL